MNAVAVDMEFEPVAEPPAPTLLKQQVGERLAAHRSRRAQMVAESGAKIVATSCPSESASPRSRQIASAVAQRYANSPSYHAFLAFEAEEATRRARAAAEVAERNARAVAAAQQELMAELAAAANALEAAPHAWDEVPVESVSIPPSPDAVLKEEPLAVTPQVTRAGLSVRLFEDAGRIPQRGAAQAERSAAGSSLPDDADEARALDEEISFRQSPTFELERPSVSIPGNLLEFPRQLVAARKARPRYAEGPLLAETGQDGTQLRIFEVEAEQMQPAPPVEASAAEWTSIWLDALATGTHSEPIDLAVAEVLAAPLYPAPVEQRVMATIVDGCLILAGYVGFATLFAWRAGALPGAGLAAVTSLCTMTALFAIYQALFFTFSDATPGMRYARIGLCTFSDENPTRAAMRKRALAVLLAACPLGLGFLWAFVDDDGLGWHDRLSRVYQRSY